MATVYLGRMAGPKGFSRVIAIKQLHAQFVNDTDFVNMFLDEAHLIGRIHHSNVVAPIDVVEADGDLCIVMEYVHGEALGRLMRLSRPTGIPLRVVTAIMVQTLLGLHSAHEVTDGDGKPLSIVHRDVSPQNILVGEDGITRVVDFGIAKAAHLARPSDTGKLKGKLGYMAPEQFLGGELDRRCDIFSAGIILWEMLTGKKLFAPADPVEATERMRSFEPRTPSSVVETVSSEFDAIVLKALAAKPEERFATAHDMAKALEAACSPASAIEVAEWVKPLVGDTLSTRAAWIQDLISLDLSEWTQTYVMTSSASPPANPAELEVNAGSTNSKSVPPDTIREGRARCPSVSPTEKREELVSKPPKRKTSKARLGAWMVLLVSVLVIGVIYWSRNHAGVKHHEISVFAASPASFGRTLPSNHELSSAKALNSAVESESAKSAGTSMSSAVPVPSAGDVTPPTSSAPSKNSVGVTHRGSTSGGRADCRVPYVIDAKGIKRFRPECFR
jgi:serine/threonine-protein kinase